MTVTDAVHDIAFAPNLGRSFHVLAIATKDVRIFKLVPMRWLIPFSHATACTYSRNPVSYTCCICRFLLVWMFFKWPQEGELVHRIHQVRGADRGPVWQPQLAGVAGELEHHQHAAGLLRGRRLCAALERCEFTVSHANSWSQLNRKLLFAALCTRYSAGIVWFLLLINLRQILKRVEAQPSARFMVSCSTHLMMCSMQICWFALGKCQLHCCRKDYWCRDADAGKLG